MLLKGSKPAEVAAAVGVARQTVYTWQGLLEEGSIEALRAVCGRGRPARRSVLGRGSKKAQREGG